MSKEKRKMEDCVSFTVDAVLPAGGVGQRMNSETPKQFIEVCGKPIICYTIEVFESISWIRKIVVPVASGKKEFLEDLMKKAGYSKTITVEGKSTRHRSIYEGVKRLKVECKEPDVVIIHDAVRPLLDEAILRKVATAAKNHGASGAVRPLVSTVVVKDQEDFMDHSIDRSSCRSSEMPQAFNYSYISEAYSKATHNEFEYGTECLQLVRTHCNIKAKLIDGAENLWKVTHQQDILTLERTLKAKRKVEVYLGKSSDRPNELCQHVMNDLNIQNIKVTKIHRNNHELPNSNEAENDLIKGLSDLQHAGDNLRCSVLFLEGQQHDEIFWRDHFPLLFASHLSLIVYSERNPLAVDIEETLNDRRMQNRSGKNPEKENHHQHRNAIICGVSYTNVEGSDTLNVLSSKIATLISNLTRNRPVFMDGQILHF